MRPLSGFPQVVLPADCIRCLPAAGPQAQRAAAGLPPERGASAAILSAVQDLLHDTIRPHLCIFAVVLTGSLWDWACTLASRAALLDTAGT